MEFEEKAKNFRSQFFKLSDELGKVIVGQKSVVEGVLTCLFAGGNALLEGVPGLGKTLLIKSLSDALDLPFSRIQFTPDLMPADIIGTEIIDVDENGRRTMRFQKGPLFSQIILADEINRATPKTQSALLEAMQEHSVTASGQTYKLEEPFLILATQNPLEMEGTYLLPEAQLDRFFMKILVPFTTRDELNEILQRTTGEETQSCEKVLNREDILEARKVVNAVVVIPEIRDYAVRLVLATHPELENSPEVCKKNLRWGASPRGAQGLLRAAKVNALVAERYNVSFHDIQRVAHDVLRHRVALNFEAQADGLSEDEVLTHIIEEVKTPSKEMSA
jgi:MoxR-like ATPase